ncbi:hypothetical protein PIB30_026153 [Stylosanthes scabra]|uniref:Uncharacterized protein n=1 Tax=Stylosanthes scabra TaxID=79078 RepID=A0ABU6V9G4_9FABA|nr:hypothetical protein [Stylosanthes scabra]
MRTHASSLCVRICAETAILGVPPTSRCVRMASLLRTHLVQQWPSRFCCNPFVPLALSGHFHSELRLLNPETLERTHQGIVRNGKQFKTQKMWDLIGEEFKREVITFFEDVSLDKNANLTFVTLALKEGGTNGLDDF